MHQSKTELDRLERAKIPFLLKIAFQLLCEMVIYVFFVVKIVVIFCISSAKSFLWSTVWEGGGGQLINIQKYTYLF